MRSFALAIAFGLAALGLAGNSAIADRHMAKAIKTVDTSKGPVLANAKGMTLYIFDKDSTNMSVCYGGCAKKWPPMLAAAMSKGDGHFTVVARKDGTRQWAYKGRPLYTWFKDKKPGDVTGDGVKGLWQLARP